MSSRLASKPPELNSPRRTIAWNRSRGVAAFPARSCCVAALCVISRSRPVSIACTFACRRRRTGVERLAKVFLNRETSGEHARDHGRAAPAMTLRRIYSVDMPYRKIPGVQWDISALNCKTHGRRLESIAEGLRRSAHENIARRTEPSCRGNYERGRRASRVSSRGLACYCSHAAAGRRESIRDYLRHICRCYQCNKPGQQRRSFRRRRRATRQGLGESACAQHLPNGSNRHRSEFVAVPGSAADTTQIPIWATF